jgi:hypothetical protein
MATQVQKVVPAAIALGILIQTAVPAFAQSYNSYNNNNGYNPPSYNNGNNYNSTNTPPPQQGRVAFVPAGMMFPVSLSTSISTDVASPGDMISGTLSDSINLGNTVIPAGSMVTGRVVASKAGGFLGRSGMLTVKFNSLRTPNGCEVPMSAHVVGEIGKYNETSAQSGTYAGETWKNKVGQTALRGGLGAGLGAGLGTAIGAIAGSGTHRTGRAVGRGAWSGAAIGGGLGVADSLLLRKGKNVKIAAGTPIQLQLDAPMSLSQNTQMGAF